MIRGTELPPPPPWPRAVAETPSPSPIAYTFATLVTDHAQYADMVASFDAGGFGAEDCEYLYLDNSKGNRLGAYRGLNRLLDEARGKYVVLCHQDLRLLADGRAALDARLAELDSRDPAWALAGNAGGVAPGKLALRISDPHGSNVHAGDLPERVASLDENFIVTRRDARVACSRDLDGFHFYGTDLCLQAEKAGWRAYVIDFHLRHLSAGRRSEDFFECERRLVEKYAAAMRPRWVQTTCALFFLSPSTVLGRLGCLVGPWIARLLRKLPGSRGWSRPARLVARTQ
jgi:hypothetical protein